MLPSQAPREDELISTVLMENSYRGVLRARLGFFDSPPEML